MLSMKRSYESFRSGVSEFLVKKLSVMGVDPLNCWILNLYEPEMTDVEIFLEVKID